MSSPRALRSRVGGAVALVLAVVGALLVQHGGGDPAPSRPAAVTQQAQTADGLPTVRAASLPAQARRTLALLDAGGPFPYARDGVVFANREGLLPDQRRGCYHEYTVTTPGEADRGARRIVTSCAGPRYWSADHYESFARIAP